MRHASIATRRGRSTPRWGLVALTLGAAGLALHGGPWDHRLFQAVNGTAPMLAAWASVLSVLGLGAAMLLIAGGCGPRAAWPLAAALVIVLAGGLLVHLLKLGVASERPLAVLGAAGVHVVGDALRHHSMPSGHAALWAAVAAVAWLAPLPVRWTARRPWLVAGVLVVAGLGALARVVVGAHWPSDLLVGSGLGVAVGGGVAGTVAGRRGVDRVATALRSRAGSRLVAALMVALSASLWVADPADSAAAACQAVLGLPGLLAAWRWWRLHPGPAAARAPRSRPVVRVRT